MKRIVWAWGAVVTALFAASVYCGWSFASVDEVKDVPRSVRDNPGSYRSHYHGGK